MLTGDLSVSLTLSPSLSSGIDRLKEALQGLGLKTGGTLRERASRLFLTKSTPLAQLDKKHFAKGVVVPVATSASASSGAVATADGATEAKKVEENAWQVRSFGSSSGLWSL